MAANDRSSASDFPGVRNRIYESPRYGSSLIWNKEIWTPVSSNDDALVLKADGSTIEMNWRDAGISADEWVEETVCDMLSRDGTHEICEEPANGRALGKTTYGDGRAIVWDIASQAFDDPVTIPNLTPHLVRSVHTADADRYKDELKGKADEVWDSLQPPCPNWDDPSRHDTGVIDVFKAIVIEWTPSTLRLRMELDNVDEPDAVFDIARLYAAEKFQASGVEWEPDSDTSPSITIPTDEKAIGVVTFDVTEAPLFDVVCYQQETTCWPVALLGGIIGAGSRPRIDPGR